MEKERFGKRLTYEIVADAASRELLIPPIIIQPIVENSVKHGISPQIEGGHIAIKVTHKNDVLEISICDTGKGINGEAKDKLLCKGVGLSNTNERLIKMYGTGIELTENRPKGLCVSFSVPLNKTEMK